MDPDSSLKATAKYRFNGVDLAKRDLDLSAKNSEDYDSTQLNKSEFYKAFTQNSGHMQKSNFFPLLQPSSAVQYTREWPS